MAQISQQPEVKTDDLVGCAKWQPLIDKFGWDKRIASAVLEAESQCKLDAVGDTWEIAGVYAPSCGLFQIRTLAGRPSCDELKSPEVNVEWAWKLYQSGGWKHWSVYNNGKYKQYLK